MFWNATAFNQDISPWNVARADAMLFMFTESTTFDQNLSQWNVTNVLSIWTMFNGATAFNQSLSSWDVANVNDMEAMLMQCCAGCTIILIPNLYEHIHFLNNSS
jgi:surface protein